jgi:hypothetical protein
MKTPLMAALLDAATKRDQYRELLAEARKKHKQVLEADHLVRQLRGLEKARTQGSRRAA